VRGVGSEDNPLMSLFYEVFFFSPSRLGELMVAHSQGRVMETYQGVWYVLGVSKIGKREPRNMTTERRIITVDGVGASGKSALARLLAERLGFAHLNSGLLYRAAGFLVSQAGIPADDNSAVGDLLKRHTIELKYDRATGNQVFIDGVLRGDDLQGQEISKLASFVAKLPSVREHFVDVQRTAFAPAGVVAEGRDMGTVIFPDAHPKFFINADLRVRAERRRTQLLAKGEAADLETIESDLARRDYEDAHRELAPMKPAERALLVDNSNGTLDEIVETMYQRVVG
jgi:cytidylate kinase